MYDDQPTGPVLPGARDNGDVTRPAVRHAYYQGDAAAQESLDARRADRSPAVWLRKVDTRKSTKVRLRLSKA